VIPTENRFRTIHAEAAAYLHCMNVKIVNTAWKGKDVEFEFNIDAEEGAEKQRGFALTLHTADRLFFSLRTIRHMIHRHKNPTTDRNQEATHERTIATPVRS
jgi:hypothetical protein